MPEDFPRDVAGITNEWLSKVFGATVTRTS